MDVMDSVIFELKTQLKILIEDSEFYIKRVRATEQKILQMKEVINELESRNDIKRTEKVRYKNRKLRASYFHKEMFKTADKAIKKKQDKIYQMIQPKIKTIRPDSYILDLFKRMSKMKKKL